MKILFFLLFLSFSKKQFIMIDSTKFNQFNKDESIDNVDQLVLNKKHDDFLLLSLNYILILCEQYNKLLNKCKITDGNYIFVDNFLN